MSLLVKGRKDVASSYADENNQLRNAHDIIRAIADFSASVRERQRACGTTACSHCSFSPDSGPGFSLHGCRPRRFYVIAGPFVQMVQALLPRWRCPACHRTFTEYPDFAMHHRQYTVAQMKHRVLNYAKESSVAYRSGVLNADFPIFHGDAMAPAEASEEGGVINDRALAHTSLFHWVTLFGRESAGNPPATVVGFEPLARKYQSEDRRQLLIHCCVQLS